MYNLNPLTINLHGLNLIEASAGTGKTYTLTTLYLRLLLERGLAPQNILVVTFTEAATEALRARVRERIVKSLRQLTHPQSNSDPELSALFERVAIKSSVLDILTHALQHSDEAAIFTIHSFCQQMLQDYAFETGLSFATEIVTDETALRRAATADAWRRRLAAATTEETAWILSQWPNPWELLAAINPTLTQDELRLLPILDSTTLQPALAQISLLFERIRTQWPQVRAACLELLLDNPALHKTYYSSPKITVAAAALDAWVENNVFSPQLTIAIALFQTTTLIKRTLKNRRTPVHPFFTLCNELDIAEWERTQRLRQVLWLQQTRTQIQENLTRNKVEQELLSYDDLLQQLDAALAADHATSSAACDLASIIRTRFPVALIDEFQDTDPKQYRIFRRIYADNLHSGLFLIGDPKQAIYAFRGADVFTYMQARTAAVRHQAEHTLGTNWRSNSRLVTAINCIFSQAPVPFVDANIPFRVVQPSHNADAAILTVNGTPPVPLQLWIVDTSASPTEGQRAKAITIPVANAASARACAEYIAQLLQAADAGHATIGSQPLRSKDIAVLVRSHKEGTLMQQALNMCGIRCVTLSQDSVFDSAAAEELVVVLQAIAKPNDEGLWRAALVTTLLGWNAAELDALSHDEKAWELLLVKFQDYYRLWIEKSFITAFQKLVVNENIPQKLLRLPDGERWLTDLLQLAELLQTAALHCVVPEELLRWFISQRTQHQPSDATRQMRLESDANLVQVITIHKSKGLEYPVVFIPFPWSLKPHKNAQVLFHDPQDFTPCLDLGSDAQETNQNLQHKEDLAEQMRLFYVALTRAAHLCVLCWGPVNQAENSAPALLLHPAAISDMPTSRLKNLDAASIKAELEALATAVPTSIAVQMLPISNGIRFTEHKIATIQLQTAKFTRKIDSSWSVTSYSMLTRGDESLRPEHDAALDFTVPQPAELINAEPVDLLFAFPAGAESGLFLHAILEHVDFANADAATLHTAICNLLPSYASLRTKSPLGAEDWSSVAAEMLSNCLDTPLAILEPHSDILRLRDITWDNRLSELEFHYPITKLTPQHLQAALAPFPAYRETAAGLNFASCQGLIHGFIDLIFRHRNRYYLADYKSNRLGLKIADYNRDGMYQAMRSHRYDLQYLVYTVALHRFLQQRLLDYNYEQHYGGVFYLFLRGMRPSLGTEYGVYFDRPQYSIIQSLESLL